MARSFAIDSYIRDAERTCVLVRRGDGRVGVHCLKTGALLGILDPRDQREQEDPVPGAGAMLWGVGLLCVAVLCYVCVHVGIWLARMHP